MAPMIAKCFRCKTDFETDNPMDKDGFGRCGPCKEAVRVIAAEIDAKAASRPKAPPKVKLDDMPRIPGTNFIHWKSL